MKIFEMTFVDIKAVSPWFRLTLAWTVSLYIGQQHSSTGWWVWSRSWSHRSHGKYQQCLVLQWWLGSTV